MKKPFWQLVCVLSVLPFVGCDPIGTDRTIIKVTERDSGIPISSACVRVAHVHLGSQAWESRTPPDFLTTYGSDIGQTDADGRLEFVLPVIIGMPPDSFFFGVDSGQGIELIIVERQIEAIAHGEQIEIEVVSTSIEEGIPESVSFDCP